MEQSTELSSLRSSLLGTAIDGDSSTEASLPAGAASDASPEPFLSAAAASNAGAPNTAPASNAGGPVDPAVYSPRFMFYWSNVWFQLGVLGFTSCIGIILFLLVDAIVIPILDDQGKNPESAKSGSLKKFMDNRYLIEVVPVALVNLVYVSLHPYQKKYLYASTRAKNILSLLLLDEFLGWRLVRVMVVNALYYWFIRDHPYFYSYGILALCVGLISLVKVIGRKGSLFIIEDFAVYFSAPAIDRFVAGQKAYGFAYLSITVFALIAWLTPYIHTPEVDEAVREDEERQREAKAAAEERERQREAEALADGSSTSSYRTALGDIFGGVMFELFGTRFANRRFPPPPPPPPLHLRASDEEAQQEVSERTSGVSWASVGRFVNDSLSRTRAWVGLNQLQQDVHSDEEEAAPLTLPTADDVLHQTGRGDQVAIDIRTGDQGESSSTTTA